VRGRLNNIVEQDYRVRTNHLIPSMSRRRSCWDNAVAEPFFSRKKGTYQEKDLQE
jgi:transposase InsO family protein